MSESDLESRFSDLPEGPLPGIGSLAAMFAEIEVAPEIYRPTKFWSNYAQQHVDQLREDGFDRFKRTINRNYFQFQFMSPLHPMARSLWVGWLKRPRVAPVRATLVAGVDGPQVEVSFRRLRTQTYARYIALLADEVRNFDVDGLLDRLDEPLLGDPIYVEYRGRRVTEDLCNSVKEYSSVVAELGPRALKDDATVIELGAGYGRLAWVWLMARPDLRYVVVDIPPALAVAEQYLTALFPDKPVFGFRHFDGESEVADELGRAKLVFLTPNQLDLLPSLRAQLFLNVSSLHEMVKDQIDNYFRVIAEHTDGWFYSKQWYNSVNETDGIEVNHDDYPVPPNWRVKFDRDHSLNDAFFEALYEVN